MHRVLERGKGRKGDGSDEVRNQPYIQVSVKWNSGFCKLRPVFLPQPYKTHSLFFKYLKKSIFIYFGLENTFTWLKNSKVTKGLTGRIFS